MKSHTIIVTGADMDRLDRLIRAQRHSLFRDQQQLDLLDRVLQNADVRPPNRTPKTVVRMNSSVLARDLDTRQKEIYTLVFPEEADISKGHISVLAPVGIALLGHRKKDLVEARVPGGIRRLRIEQVWQETHALGKHSPKDQPIRHQLALEPDLAA